MTALDINLSAEIAVRIYIGRLSKNAPVFAVDIDIFQSTNGAAADVECGVTGYIERRVGNINGHILVAGMYAAIT